MDSQVRVGRTQSRRDVEPRVIRNSTGSRQTDLFGHAEPDDFVTDQDLRVRAVRYAHPTTAPSSYVPRQPLRSRRHTRAEHAMSSSESPGDAATCLDIVTSLS